MFQKKLFSVSVHLVLSRLLMPSCISLSLDKYIFLLCLSYGLLICCHQKIGGLRFFFKSFYYIYSLMFYEGDRCKVQKISSRNSLSPSTIWILGIILDFQGSQQVFKPNEPSHRSRKQSLMETLFCL